MQNNLGRKMKKITGYSLIEILVSLFLITSTILALMRHHWQLNKQINQNIIEFYTLIENTNQKEQQITQEGFYSQLGGQANG